LWSICGAGEGTVVLFDVIDWIIVAVFMAAGAVLMQWFGTRVSEQWRQDVYVLEKVRLHFVMTAAGALAGWLISLAKAVPAAILVWAAYTPPPVPLIAVPLAVIFVAALPVTILGRVMLWVWEPFYWRTVSPRTKRRIRVEHGLPPERVRRSEAGDEA